MGEYSAQIQLAFPSFALKSVAPAARGEVVLDLERVLRATRPEVVYTHNLADKHDTHVAVCLRLLEACRRLPAEDRPRKVIGCEVWRDLDWLCDEDKLVMPVDSNEALQAALLSVFDSQIAGGYREVVSELGHEPVLKNTPSASEVTMPLAFSDS